MSEQDAQVAIYWDFENIHGAVLDEQYGEGTYGKQDNRFRTQEPVVDIRPIVQYASTLGTIVINRAYGNWQWFSRYRGDLLGHAIDLVQLFPVGGRGKNGADIRLALDALQDLHHFSHITHVIVVAGDSDFMGLAQKCRQSGRTIIGIAGRGSSGAYWETACSEFKYYDTLLKKMNVVPDERSAPEFEEVPLLRRAHELLVAAMMHVESTRGTATVRDALLKQVMTRLDNKFDEASLGFANFRKFLDSASHLVTQDHDGVDRVLTLTLAARQMAGDAPDEGRPLDDSQGASPAAARRDEDDDPIELYARILARRFAPLDPHWRTATLQLVAEIFAAAPNNQVASFADLDEQLQSRLAAEDFESDEQDIRTLREMLYTLRLFDLWHRPAIGLCIDSNGDELVEAVDGELIKHVVRFAPKPVDLEALCIAIYGSATPPEERRELFDRLLRQYAK